MVSLQHISKVFNKGQVNEVAAVTDINLVIQPGEFVVVIGANGSGKSTFLNLIQGSVLPTHGAIFINDTDVTALPEYRRSKWVSRVFQNPNDGTAPDLSIMENFRLAALRSRRKKLTVGLTVSFKQRVQQQIASLGMGLQDKTNQPMGSLSGGQRQALTLLMSMMDDSEMLLMDEPTAALDPKSSQAVLQLASQIHREHQKTIVFITHNLKDALQYGNRLIQFNQGRIARDLSSVEKQQLTLQSMLELFA